MRAGSPGGALAAQTGTRAVTIADLDGDGRADVVAANTGSGTVTILRGSDGGGFDTPRNVPVGKQPRTVVAADVNRDGRGDMVVANGGSNDVSVLLGAPP